MSRAGALWHFDSAAGLLGAIRCAAERIAAAALVSPAASCAECCSNARCTALGVAGSMGGSRVFVWPVS